MRWKRLRRRLPVSAPPVTFRHLPLRWAVAGVVLGFSGVLALWALETGKTLPHPVRRPCRRRRRKAECAARDRLAQELRQAQGRRLALASDLGFFELLLPASRDRALQAHALQAVSPMSRHTRYPLPATSCC